MNVLIVDDDSIKAKWSEDSLRLNQEVKDVKIVSYAKDAIRLLEGGNIDLVVLDMQFCLSQGNFDKFAGIFVLKEMKENPRIDEGIPVVVCSSGSYLKELDNYSNLVAFLRYGHSNVDEIYEGIVRKVSRSMKKNGVEK